MKSHKDNAWAIKIPISNQNIIFLQCGYGSVSWLVFAELLPPAIRPTAYPLGIAIMWFVNFILTTLYEPLLTMIGTHGFLWTYAGISSVGCIFIAICLPETRGKTPYEIADFYAKKSTSLLKIIRKEKS